MSELDELGLGLLGGTGPGTGSLLPMLSCAAALGTAALGTGWFVGHWGELLNEPLDSDMAEPE